MKAPQSRAGILRCSAARTPIEGSFSLFWRKLSWFRVSFVSSRAVTPTEAQVYSVLQYCPSGTRGCSKICQSLRSQRTEGDHLVKLREFNAKVLGPPSRQSNFACLAGSFVIGYHLKRPRSTDFVKNFKEFS